MTTFYRGMILLLSSTPFGMAALAHPRADAPQDAVPAPPVDHYLYQNWSDSERADFHYRAQGSELVPYTLFLNLMEPDGTTRLRDDLERFGMLYDQRTSDVAHHNPDGLPIGFAQQKETRAYGDFVEKRWLGLTCAACHTGAILPKGGSNPTKPGTFLLDGAPARADVAAFLTTLRRSVATACADDGRLGEIADKAIASGEDGTHDQVVARFRAFGKQFDNIMRCYLPQDHAGPGRLDCFGAIINRVCVYDAQSGQSPNPAPLNAPVDYPFIWYSDRQSQIQWFGELPNSNWVERLARNSGEVSGVFAQIDVRSKPGLGGYASSLNVKGLNKLDAYVSKLKAPKWTDVFPRPESTLWDKGKDLYRKNCTTSSCHQDLARQGSVTEVAPTPLEPNLNTDENNTKMVHSTIADTGLLKGTREFFVVGDKIGDQSQGTALVGTVVAGSLLHQWQNVIDAFIDHLLGNLSLSRVWASLQAHNKISQTVLADAYQAPGRTAPGEKKGKDTGYDPKKHGYEARSLNGIWATAPYLHNGSVPNLAQLLWLDKRDATFHTGSFVYDPEKVGYVSDGTAGGTPFDTHLSGNHNTGHDYGRWLTPDDKRALIAYLKTL